MAGTLNSSSIQAALNFNWSDSGVPPVKVTSAGSYFKQFVAGAGGNTKLYAKKLTIAASGNQVLTLSALTDPEGVALAFTKVHAVYIENNKLTTASSILVAPNVTNPWAGPFQGGATGGLNVPNDAPFCMPAPSVAGWPVGVGATDQLKIANNDGVNTATVLVYILGE